MTGTEPWRTLWEEYEEPGNRRAVADACAGIRSITEYDSPEPTDTIALAIAGAEATEGLRDALESDWALYTPQQAAVVASALFAQLNATTVVFESLRRLIQHAEARRETAFTTEADDRLTHVAAAVTFTRGFAPGVVGALNACPDLARLPTDAHETLAAVAALLGPAAKVTENHGPDEHSEDDSGFGCGGEIRFEHRGDSSWDLVRERDGEMLEDGSTSYTERNELEVTDSTAHPLHLLTLIRAKLDETS
ncbi:hypothetical protein [Streptomyces sp. NRRL S-237]|uniref:hypothetical protein n=1 Tax=Streptomyces sp. NRRL S-237 TaxID=1463895 RepID=UPI0004CA6E41|nr:hypothetical protein [Streptomyces sp. NRRL S-237]